MPTYLVAFETVIFRSTKIDAESPEDACKEFREMLEKGAFELVSLESPSVAPIAEVGTSDFIAVSDNDVIREFEI